MIKKIKDYEYRTYQFRIKNTHPLFNYCDDICFKSKNLYNVANFYIRQTFSGLRKEPTLRHENETNVISNINSNITKLNEIRIDTFDKRKDYKTTKVKKEEPSLFKELDKTNSFVGFTLLDGIFKISEQSDYKNLPAQTNQLTLKLLEKDWKSFFMANNEYKINPSKFKGKPKPPKYAKKDGRKITKFTNQSCLIKNKNDKVYLSFPKTKLTLELGKEIGSKINKLKEVRIIPNSPQGTP